MEGPGFKPQSWHPTQAILAFLPVELGFVDCTCYVLMTKIYDQKRIMQRKLPNLVLELKYGFNSSVNNPTNATNITKVVFQNKRMITVSIFFLFFGWLIGRNILVGVQLKNINPKGTLRDTINIMSKI
jgi:hypothetical protein